MQDVQELSIEELKQHPDIILNILLQEDNVDVSIFIRREGNTVRFSSKQYNSQVSDILKKADKELGRRNQEGYTEEQAGQDFVEAREKIINKYF